MFANEVILKPTVHTGTVCTYVNSPTDQLVAMANAMEVRRLDQFKMYVRKIHNYNTRRDS